METKKMITTPAIVEVALVEDETMDEIAAWCGGTHVKSPTGDYINLNNSEAAYPGGYIVKYGPNEAYSFTEKLLARRFLSLSDFVNWTGNVVTKLKEASDAGTD